MKILVVDDFDTTRKIIRNILQQVDLTDIVEAKDGDVALDVLKNIKVDLVIADWNMPHMSGLELLEKVRDDKELKDIPFIMVTAEAQGDNIMNAIRARVSQYLIKPFTPEALLQKISQVMPSVNFPEVAKAQYS